MAIQIRDIRISLSWTELIPELLDGSPLERDFAFLNKSWSYESRFNQILDSPNPDPLDLGLPWPRGEEGQRFWRFYLEKKLLAAATGRVAWRNLVPLHRRMKVDFQPKPPARYSFDAFFYPFGIALLCKFRVGELLSLQAATDRCVDLRRGSFNVAARRLTLDQFADEVFTKLRRELFGDRKVTPIRDPEPFQIVTIVNGQGADSSEKPADHEAVHYAIHSMAASKRVRPKDVLPALPEADLKPPTSARVLYSQPRARTVWYPDLFSDSSAGCHSLACYHQNLTLLSQQVELLGALVRFTAEEIGQGHQLKTETHTNCARFAGGILGRLRGAADSTYRSRSPGAQMTQSALDGPIDLVRKELNTH